MERLSEPSTLEAPRYRSGAAVCKLHKCVSLLLLKQRVPINATQLRSSKYGETVLDITSAQI